MRADVRQWLELTVAIVTLGVAMESMLARAAPPKEPPKTPAKDAAAEAAKEAPKDSPSDAAKELMQQVRQRIRGLSAPELSSREQAEKSLIELGPDALPHLPEINDKLPAEVADRLRRVRQALLREQVEAAARSSLITLHGKDLPLAEVLAAFAKQSGNKLIDHRAEFGEQVAEKTLTLDLDKQPFWQALDEVLDQAGLGVYGYGTERAVYLVSRPSGHGSRQAHVSYSGPFRVAPTRFEATVDLQNPANRSLKLFLEVAWEPRLRPIALVEPLAAIQAESAAGPLTVDGGAGEPEFAAGTESTTVEMFIPLQLPPRSVEKITRLKGRFNALVPGPVEEFRFANLPVAKNGAEAKRVEQRKGAVVVSVEPLRKNNDVWEVEMHVKFDNPGPALDSHRGWIFENEAYLEDAKGNHNTPGGYEQTRQAADSVGIRYLFDIPGGPSGQTFVYKTPLAILEIPIDYELKDLPLP